MAASNPLIVACPKGVWTKVATNEQKAIIFKKITAANYYHTYRLTGVAAPTTLADGITFSKSIEYDHSAAIDIYIFCQLKAGSVRVDA